VFHIFSREIFASRIKELRQTKGLSQAAFGKNFGLTKQTVNDIEHLRATTTLEKLYEIADFFGVTSDYLLGLSDDPARR
jgi:transcriptional regulator with XRE-family HTH domain